MSIWPSVMDMLLLLSCPSDHQSWTCYYYCHVHLTISHGHVIITVMSIWPSVMGMLLLIVRCPISWITIKFIHNKGHTKIIMINRPRCDPPLWVAPALMWPTIINALRLHWCDPPLSMHCACTDVTHHYQCIAPALMWPTIINALRMHWCDPPLSIHCACTDMTHHYQCIAPALMWPTIINALRLYFLCIRLQFLYNSYHIQRFSFVLLLLLLLNKCRQCKAEREWCTPSVRRPQPHNTNL